MFSCNVFIPQLFWSKRIRRSLAAMFTISIFVNIGMWFERFNIFILSLEKDFLPVSWSYFKPTLFDIGMTLSSFGMFFTLFLLFSRVLPTLAMAELKTVLHNPHAGGADRPFQVLGWPRKTERTEEAG